MKWPLPMLGLCVRCLTIGHTASNCPEPRWILPRVRLCGWTWARCRPGLSAIELDPSRVFLSIRR